MSHMADEPRRRRNGRRLAAVAGVVLAAALAAAWFGWNTFVGSGPAPAPVALEDTPAPAAGESGSDPQDVSAASPDGTWTVRAGEDSFVGYRVSEQLGFLDSPNEAVGRTTAVTGTLEVAGGQVVSGRVEADLQELTSDESRRDNAIRQRGLESAEFPTASFELIEPVTLNQDPAAGQTVTTEATGELTLHGVTREVTVTLEGRWSGETIEVAGQVPIRMSDYGITPPQGGPVISVEDAATVELQLTFTRS